MIYKLEDRVLFDAALPVDVVDAVEPQQAEVADDTNLDATGAESFEAASSSEEVEAGAEDTTELVEDSLSDALAALSDFSEIEPQNLYIIDSSVPDYQVLIDQISDGSHVELISPFEDGLGSITSILENYSDLDSISIITEGNTGYFELAGERVDAEFVAENSSLFESFGDALSESGDIKIFSCFTGRGEQGADLAEALATVTRADIGLSTNSTGDLGQGDWTLEYTHGVVEDTTLDIETTGVRLESAGGTATGVMTDYQIEKVNADGTAWTGGDAWYAINSGEDLIQLTRAMNDGIGGVKLDVMWDSNADGTLDTTLTGELDKLEIQNGNLLITGDITFDETEGNVDWDGSGVVGDGTDADGFSGFGGASLYGFNGQLNGNNYSITNLFIDRGAYTGFFAKIGGGATISDLSFTNADVSSNGDFSGIVAGQITGDVTFTNVQILDTTNSTNSALLNAGFKSGAFAGAITAGAVNFNDCLVDGNVWTGNYIVGGYVGDIENGTVTFNDSKFTGEVKGTNTLGGFVGRARGGSVTFVDSQIDDATLIGVNNQANTGFGGFIGAVTAGAVTVSQSNVNDFTVTVNDTASQITDIGGFLGSVTGATANIYNSDLTGTTTFTGGDIGGIIGSIGTGSTTSVHSSYIADTITFNGTKGGRSGGIVGDIATGASVTISHCGVDSSAELAGTGVFGGLVGGIDTAGTTSLNVSNSYYGGNYSSIANPSTGNNYASGGGIIAEVLNADNTKVTFSNLVYANNIGEINSAGVSGKVISSIANTGTTSMTSADMKTNAIETPMDFTTVNALTGVKWVRTDGSYPTLQYAAPGSITLTNSDTQVGSTYIEKTGDSITLGGKSPITSGTLPYKVKVTFSDGTNADKIKYITGTGITDWTDNFDLSSSDLNLIKDTTYTVTVSAVTDKGAAADSAVTASETFSLIYTDDTTAPTYSGEALAATGTGKAVNASGGTTYTNDDTPSFSFTLSDTNGIDSGSLSVTITDSDAGTNETITLNAGSSSGDDYVYDIAGLVDGKSYTITVDATDSYGNAITQQTYSFTTDTVAPDLSGGITLTTDSGNNSDKITTDADIKFGYSETNSSSVTVTFDGTVDSVFNFDFNGSTWDFDAAGSTMGSAAGTPALTIGTGGDAGKLILDLSSLTTDIADGTYTVNVDSVDVAGNSATQATLSNVVIDTAKPTATLDSIADPVSGYSNDGTFTLEGDITDATVDNTLGSGTITITNSSSAVVVNAAAITIAADGSWSYNAAGLADDSYTLSVSVTDAAGNTIASPVTGSFVVDSTAPTDPAVADATIHFSGGTTDRAQTVTAGDSITVEGAYDDTLGGSPETLLIVDASGTELATYALTDNSTNNWSVSIDTSSLSGSVELFVKVRDTAGNVSNVSTSKIDLTVEVPVEPEYDPVVVDPVVETPTSSDPVTTTGGTETAVDAGLEDSLIVQETSIDTDVELYTGQPESTEQTMEQVAQQISQTLSVAYSHFDLNVTVETPTFADTFNAVETASEANAAAGSNTPAPQSQPMTMEVFKQLDTDTSGSLKVEELNQRYEGIDFDKADLNDDGIIDEDEFKKLIIEMEKGNDKGKPISQQLNDSTHVLESAPRYADAFQSPLERSLAILTAV